MKHTKGQWKHIGYPEERVQESGIDICLINPARGVDEANANAKLIAAAPELLEALEEAEAALHMLGGKKIPPTKFIPCEVQAYRIVVKAIKKATS